MSLWISCSKGRMGRSKHERPYEHVASQTNHNVAWLVRSKLVLGSKLELELGSKLVLALGSKPELELGNKLALELGSKLVLAHSKLGLVRSKLVRSSSSS